MKNFLPLISVIVPVYNAQDYVERCVRSLMKQTYQNLEIILIDDGSTDDSLDICGKLKMEDGRIRVFSQPNRGIGAVRNLGLSLAQGAYLAFVDSDDWIDSDMYESLWKLMAERQADIVCCAHCREEEKRTVVVGGGADILEFSRKDAFEALRQEQFILNFLWDKLFRRELFDGITFPEKRKFEDLIVSPQWLSKANKVVYLSQPKYHYSVRSGSLTNGIKSTDMDWRYEMVKALAEQNRFCKEHHLWEKASGKLFRTCVHLLNRLLLLPVTPAYQQMQAYCLSVIQEKDSVKGLGISYRFKQWLLADCWVIYTHLYRWGKKFTCRNVG